MAVRIGGGGFHRRRLNVPAGGRTRPLLGRIKRSLFDALAPRLPGARILDAFAGSGSFGFEALSRGAEEAVMVDADVRAVRELSEAGRRLGVGRRLRVSRGDAVSAMRALGSAGHRFEVIFLDPPFAWDRAAELLALSAPLVADGGVVIIRLARRRELPIAPRGLHLIRTGVYGASKVGWYGQDAGGTEP